MRWPGSKLLGIICRPAIECHTGLVRKLHGRHTFLIYRLLTFWLAATFQLCGKIGVGAVEHLPESAAVRCSRVTRIVTFLQVDGVKAAVRKALVLGVARRVVAAWCVGLRKSLYVYLRLAICVWICVLWILSKLVINHLQKMRNSLSKELFLDLSSINRLSLVFHQGLHIVSHLILLSRERPASGSQTGQNKKNA